MYFLYNTIAYNMISESKALHWCNTMHPTWLIFKCALKIVGARYYNTFHLKHNYPTCLGAICIHIARWLSITESTTIGHITRGYTRGIIILWACPSLVVLSKVRDEYEFVWFVKPWCTNACCRLKLWRIWSIVASDFSFVN